MTNNICLNRKLDQYSSTVKGQITQGKSLTEIAGYAAAAGVTLAMAGTADAAIIYSGVQNVSIAIDPTAVATGTSFSQYASASIDIDGGGADLGLGASFVGGLDPVAGVSAKYFGAAFAYPTGGAQLLVTAGVKYGAANLASGALIGPTGSFTTTPAANIRLVDVYATGTFGYNIGEFALGATGIAGIKLGSGNFGWIRLRVDDLGLNQPFGPLLPGGIPLNDGAGFADQITFIDWAYDDSGKAIRAGQTQSVPEPSPLALLAAGAVGIAAFRRRKVEKKVH